MLAMSLQFQWIFVYMLYGYGSTLREGGIVYTLATKYKWKATGHYPF